MSEYQKLHTIYRSSASENRKRRPPFYSKEMALRSFLGALGGAPSGDRVFVNDGAVPRDRLGLMSAWGETVSLPGVGNCRSFSACVAMAEIRDWSDEDLVYFAEDDYIHLPDAFRALAAAISAFPSVDYFTLYDNPDYGRMARHRAFMLTHRGRGQAGGRSWRAVRSTCLTFAARLGALRQDAWVYHLCSRENPPADYAVWAILGGHGISFAIPRLLRTYGRPRSRTIARGWLRMDPRPPRRVLYASRPGLAAHLEEGVLPSGQDWATAAAEAASQPNAPGPRSR